MNLDSRDLGLDREQSEAVLAQMPLPCRVDDVGDRLERATSCRVLCHRDRNFNWPTWFVRLIWGALALALVGASTPLLAQGNANKGARAEKPRLEAGDGLSKPHLAKDSSAPRYTRAQEVCWDFGMKITASGPARGIVGTVPLPLDWPEQTLLSEDEHRPAQVGRISLSQPTKESRMMTFNINQLAAGETIEVFYRFRIEKRQIEAPELTSNLRVPEKPSAATRNFLKPSPYIESRHKRIVSIAESLKDDSLSDWDQIEKVYAWVRSNLKYEFDSQIRPCLEALDAGKGDCEEMSSMFIAICRALKIPARAVLIPEHTYPEFYLEDENGQGYWFPCQLAGEYQFGCMTELRPVLHKGDRFKVAGQSGLSRYLQPTLIEKSGQGQITIEWITRTVAPNSESPADND